MEKWIIRGVALLCASGGLGLAWAFGAFAAVPLRDGRLFDMTGNEMQIIGISLGAGLVVAWGALHIASLADKESSPRAYRLLRLAYGAALLVAIAVGASWSMARVVSL
jgi:hypothetical protein